MSRPSQVGILSTLEEPLAWNTRLVRASVADEIRALKQQTGDPLRSIGSVSLVKSMIQLGLVDRLRLMVFPLIFGTAGGSSGATIDFLLSAKRDESSGCRFLAKSLAGENHPAPRVINADQHAGYPPAIAQLKAEGALEQDCQHRPVGVPQ
jgi:hypothetical protein